MRKEDISINVENNMLTISGERKEEKREENERVRRMERHWGSFSRSVPLPAGAKQEQIKARFENGCLSVDIPKTPQVSGRAPQRITVS